MVVSMPRKGLVNTEPPDMVRVQLKPNDVRSYRRRDAEQVLADTPGAFILGERAAESEPAPDELIPKAQDAEAAPKAQRAAPNKARQPKTTPEPASSAPPVETKSEPPVDPPSETKSE